MPKIRSWELFFSNNLFANHYVNVLFSYVHCLLSPVFYYLFFACQIFHWPLGITITCHCDLFSIHASFGSGNVAPVSFLNNNMNKGRWTQDKHKIFMQEYEKYGNNCMQIAKVLSTLTPARIKKHAECFFKQNLKKTFCSSQMVSRVPLSQWEG